MRIRLLDYVAGAHDATGVAVIIDVFRACSVACYAVAAGASRILPVAGIEEALELKRAHPEYVAIGERNARRLPGFDCGNSPSELSGLDLRNRTLVHTTHAGTQGLVAAQRAQQVLTGSLVNAAAICRYVRALQPTEVSLVRMGVAAESRSDADDLCAQLIAARLSDAPTPPGGRAAEIAAMRARLRGSSEAQKFFDPAADWAPERDFELCTDVDAFDFVLRLDVASTGPAALLPVGC